MFASVCRCVLGARYPVCLSTLQRKKIICVVYVCNQGSVPKCVCVFQCAYAKQTVRLLS